MTSNFKGFYKLKKVLFIATTAKGHLNVFHIPYMKFFKEKGWEVHTISNGDEAIKQADKEFTVSIQRSPFNIKNLKALSEIIKILKQEKYSLITCHTPMGGVLARIAALMSGCDIPIIYTAHGFHFYKGAPIVNYIIYKNMERLLSRFTDALITINHEDYEAAKKFKIKKGGKVYYIPGIGVDLDNIINKVNLNDKRNEFSIDNDAIVILSTGELIKRKNFDTAIKAFSKIDCDKAILLICGRGEEEQNLKQLSDQLNLDKRVIFAGFRKDIKEIEAMSDIFLFPSHQEGLSVALMESMAAGLPVVCSDIRGNSDLIEHGKGGYLINHIDIEGFGHALNTLIENKDLRIDMGKYNSEIIDKYSLKNAVLNMEKIYKDVLKNEV